MTTALDFIRNQFPVLFAKGISLLESRAASDPAAAAHLADIRAAKGASHFVFDGQGEVFLEVENGVCKSAASTSLPVRVAVGVEGDLADQGLAELEKSGLLEKEGAAVRIARSASAHLEKLLVKEKITFHLKLRDVPDVDEVLVRIGLGVADPPTQPGFTASVSWDDIEDMRAGKLKPQQLFMTKVKLVGDASRAMTLALQMLQPPRR